MWQGTRPPTASKCQCARRTTASKSRGAARPRLLGVAERVTVVIRTKNRPAFLRRALADVSAQEYAGWHIVIVNDDGDRREVDRVVAEAAVANVTVVDSAAPHGRCCAANTGLRAARGEYVVLHDDDDRWHPAFLGETVRWLDEHPGDIGVMVSTAIIYEEHDGDRWREIDRVPFWRGMTRISLTELFEINRAVPISFLYRRELHDIVGWYDESLDAVEDWEFYLRVIPRFPVGFIAGEPLAYWVQRPTARGAEANSMFELGDDHVRDDMLVRDRELARWVDKNGAGLPLYLAHLQRQLREDLRNLLVSELDARRPESFRQRWQRRLRRASGRR